MKKIHLVAPILGAVAAAGAGVAAVGCSCITNGDKITVSYGVSTSVNWGKWASGNPTQIDKGAKTITVKYEVLTTYSLDAFIDVFPNGKTEFPERHQLEDTTQGIHETTITLKENITSVKLVIENE